MATTIAEMTTDEFRDLIEAVIEQKLVELLGDPDAGLSLRKALQDRLRHQQQAVAAGKRGEAFDTVVRRLGLE